MDVDYMLIYLKVNIVYYPVIILKLLQRHIQRFKLFESIKEFLWLRIFFNRKIILKKTDWEWGVEICWIGLLVTTFVERIFWKTQVLW